MAVELGPTVVSQNGSFGHGALTGYPLDADVTSPFGPRQPMWTPAGWTTDFHSGIDLWRWGIEGAPIFAPAPCLVRGSYRDGAGGQVVAVQFEDGTGAQFVHMEGLQVGVGNRLRRGDLVGLVGSSGQSTGAHLHYMRMRYCGDGPVWYPRDALIDPLSPEGGFVAILSSDEQWPTPVRDVVAGEWPAPGQFATVVVTEAATSTEIVAQAAREGCSIAWLAESRNGAWLRYVVGAPPEENGTELFFANPPTALFVQAR